ncbi:MAG: cytochrome c oxidase subunit II [Candidatus Acidiferrales bacterium]
MFRAALFHISGFVSLLQPLFPSKTNIFAPASTPAQEIHSLALLVLSIAGGIFVVVGGLLTYAVIKFRRRANDDGREPAQVFGSTRIETAWTLIPVLIVIVLFLTTARVIHGIQDAVEPPGALNVTVVAHRFWWEFRYPQYGFVTANELHVPVSSVDSPRPTFLKLLSADTDHSFWVPRLAGKTEAIPNRVNHDWINPLKTGLYVGQCDLYCGVQHAHMLLRVYVQSPADFAQWVREQQQKAADDPEAADGRAMFEETACIDCHTIRGTAADGTFGPDLTHLMSRRTIAAGMLANTPENLRRWVQNPDEIKPGCMMPDMKLDAKQVNEVVSYLTTLR